MVEYIEPFLPTDKYFETREKSCKELSYDNVWNNIHRGSMPELYSNPDFDWQMYYGRMLRHILNGMYASSHRLQMR